jgi:hypothetical protein
MVMSSYDPYSLQTVVQYPNYPFLGNSYEVLPIPLLFNTPRLEFPSRNTGFTPLPRILAYRVFIGASASAALVNASTIGKNE